MRLTESTHDSSLMRHTEQAESKAWQVVGVYFFSTNRLNIAQTDEYVIQQTSSVLRLSKAFR